MKTKSIFNLLIVGFAVFLLSSCQEDGLDESLDLQVDQLAVYVPVGGTVSFDADSTFGQVSRSTSDIYQVENFYQGTSGATTGDPHVANDTYYFNFDQHDGGSDSEFWLKFSGTANGTLSAASGFDFGYTATAFDNVTINTAYTVESELGTNNIMFGSLGSFSINTSSPGWYNYDILSHILYPLVENGTDFTIIISDGSDTYAVEMQDIYYDGTPESSYAPSNYPYFKFRYKKLN